MITPGEKNSALILQKTFVQCMCLKLTVCEVLIRNWGKHSLQAYILNAVEADFSEK